MSFLHVLDYLHALHCSNPHAIDTDRVAARTGYRRRDHVAMHDGAYLILIGKSGRDGRG